MPSAVAGRDPAVARIAWKPCYRCIPTRYPPIALFERVARPEDLEAVLAIEMLTNPRVRQEVGELALVPREDRVSGPGSSVIMAAFTHLNPHGSRFSDGGYGVYYAARSLDTAIAETRYHRARFMAATREAPMRLEMRAYLADLAASLHDLRGRRDLAAVYDPDRYEASQALGRKLRESGSWGLAFDSVRHAGGKCAAVFRPKALKNCRPGPHFVYVWNGVHIEEVLEVRTVARFE